MEIFSGFFFLKILLATDIPVFLLLYGMVLTVVVGSER